MYLIPIKHLSSILMSKLICLQFASELAEEVALLLRCMVMGKDENMRTVFDI